MHGTTAAERFFEQKPRDLFMWLLDIGEKFTAIDIH